MYQPTQLSSGAECRCLDQNPCLLRSCVFWPRCILSAYQTVPQINYLSSTTLNVHFIPVSVAADSFKPACQQETNYLHQLVLKHEIAKEHLVSVFFLWLGKTQHLGVNQTGLCLDNTYSVDLDGRPVWSFH